MAHGSTEIQCLGLCHAGPIRCVRRTWPVAWCAGLHVPGVGAAALLVDVYTIGVSLEVAWISLLVLGCSFLLRVLTLATSQRADTSHNQTCGTTDTPYAMRQSKHPLTITKREQTA